MASLHAVPLLVFAVNCVSGDHFEDALYKHLLSGYIKDIRPSPRYSLPTNVTFGFSLRQIIDVDEKNQRITTSAWLNINWLDYKLAWNATDFDNLTLMHIPADRIWKPDILLTNNADPEYKEVMVSSDVFVQSEEGNVTLLISAIFQSSCRINVRFYPFDDQKCSLVFSSWSYDGSEIDLLIGTEEGDLSNFMPNGEWILQEMKQRRHIHLYSCCPNEPWPIVSIDISLRRRPLYYVFNQILPCVLISSMALLGFYIPADTGEKVTMCITTMLSMGVFLKAINESMPPTSEAVPLIGMYYGTSLFIVCAATVANVWTLKIHYMGSVSVPQPVPPWVKKFILGYMAKALFIHIEPPESLLAHVSRTGTSPERAENYAEWNNTVPNTTTLQILSSDSADAVQSVESCMCHTSVHANAMPSPGTGTGTSPFNRRHRSTKSSTPPRSIRRFVAPVQKNTALIQLQREFEEKFCRVLNRVYDTLRQNEMRMNLQDQRDLICHDWKQLSVIFDRLLLWLFISGTLVTTIVILLQPSFEHYFMSY